MKPLDRETISCAEKDGKEKQRREPLRLDEGTGSQSRDNYQEKKRTEQTRDPEKCNELPVATNTPSF